MLTRYAKDIVVDPATVEIMSKAFSSALDRLRQSGIEYPEQDAEWIRETLALRIIETVQKRGERDLDRLRDDALDHLAQANPPKRDQVDDRAGGRARSMANRLEKLNGWRRLWLISTIALGLWYVGVWPLLRAGEAHDASFDYRQAIKRDFENPQCGDYQTAPLETLQAPPGGSCWYIYASRTTNNSVATPYTLETYDNDRNSRWRHVYLVTLAVGFAATIVASAAVYFLAGLVGWILKGFTQH